jgi:hypothetical protein
LWGAVCNISVGPHTHTPHPHPRLCSSPPMLFSQFALTSCDV